MEGNHSTGFNVLPEYINILKHLDTLKDEHGFSYPELSLAPDTMTHEIKSYQDEALECDALVIATAMHPRYRLRFFSKFYPNHVDRVRRVLEAAFTDELTRNPTKKAPSILSSVPSTSKTNLDDFSDDSADDVILDTHTELKQYLDRKCIAQKGVHPLAWWKVCTSCI